MPLARAPPVDVDARGWAAAGPAARGLPPPAGPFVRVLPPGLPEGREPGLEPGRAPDRAAGLSAAGAAGLAGRRSVGRGAEAPSGAGLLEVLEDICRHCRATQAQGHAPPRKPGMRARLCDPEGYVNRP